MAEDVEENQLIEEDDVVRWIEDCVRPGSSNAKLRQVVHRIEEKSRRQLNNIELAFIQRKYVQFVLKSWLDESLLNINEDMKSTDFSTEMSTLLKQLESIQCLRDIPLLNLESKLRSWCGGERLRLILNQSDVQNLNENDFPSMSIPRDLHRETLNYAGKAKINSEFNMQQKKFMQEGKYAEAMFHAVDKNWLEPIFRNESAEVIDKVYNNLISDYLNSALNANIIDHHEVNDLKRQFTLKYNEASAIKARKRAQQWTS